MSLEWSLGYIEALKDLKMMIEEKIHGCEYALNESYSNMMENQNESL